jgi:ribosome-associated heat shock protein Hsp15
LPAPERIRLDKWLVQARFFKTRALATALVESGRIRLNGQHVAKSAQAVGAGDTLTFPQGGRIRVIRVLAVGLRRGPATEARTLYDDLDAPPAAASPLE